MRVIADKKVSCVNCGSDRVGSYCAECGQKAGHRHEAFAHMVFHFIADYFHYDHKFFRTLKTLVGKPGTLTKEYIAGKRASYLHPIQFYIFVTAVTFILFSMTFNPTVIESRDGFSINWIVGQHGVESLENYDYYDTVAMKKTLRIGTKPIADSAIYNASIASPEFSIGYGLVQFYKYFAEYAYRHHYFLYSQALTQLLNAYTYSIPKLFFLLMPWLGVLLQVFFRRRDMLYADHAVLSVHIHSFFFLLLSLVLLLFYVPGIPFTLPMHLLFWGATAYILVTCHRFYERHWIATLFLCLLIWAVYLFSVWVMSIVNLFLIMKFG